MSSRFRPPGPPPNPPSPVEGAIGVWPGPGVFSPAIAVTGGVVPLVIVGLGIGVGAFCCPGPQPTHGVAVATGGVGIGVGTVCVPGVQFGQGGVVERVSLVKFT